MADVTDKQIFYLNDILVKEGYAVNASKVNNSLNETSALRKQRQFQFLKKLYSKAK